jgi:hypothetical protein
MLTDSDPGITGIASQPFWLRWQDEDGRPRRHAPDFFARRAGGGVVVDVRPDDRIPAEDAAALLEAFAEGRPWLAARRRPGTRSRSCRWAIACYGAVS